MLCHIVMYFGYPPPRKKVLFHSSCTHVAIARYTTLMSDIHNLGRNLEYSTVVCTHIGLKIHDLYTMAHQHLPNEITSTNQVCCTNKLFGHPVPAIALPIYSSSVGTSSSPYLFLMQSSIGAPGIIFHLCVYVSVFGMKPAPRALCVFGSTAVMSREQKVRTTNILIACCERKRPLHYCSSMKR